MHNSKKWVITVLCLAVLGVVLWFLDTALYPCTYARNDIHTLVTEPKDVLILGSSNGKQGIDPDIMLEGTGLTGHNLCVGGEYPVDSYFLLKLALEKQNPSVVVYEVDPGYFATEKEYGNNYLLFYHEFPIGKAKAEYFKDTLLNADFRTIFFPFYEYSFSYELEHAADTLKTKLSGNYDASKLKTESVEYHKNGFMERQPVDIKDFPAYDPTPFSAETVVPDNVKYMDKLIDLCKEKGIKFYAIITPLYGGVLQSEAELLNAEWDYFSEYFAKKEVPFYNFNREYLQAFTHDAFAFIDYDGHMNGDAARAFSGQLGKILFGGQEGNE